MSNHFIFRLFFALASFLLPITRNAAAAIVEDGTPGVPKEQVRNELGEYSIALAGYSYINGRKDTEVDYLWDYLGTNASHNTNVLAVAGPVPGICNQPDVIASVLGVDDSVRSARNGSSGADSWSFMSNWSRKQKVIAVNATAAGVIAGLGVASWDYGKSSFHTKNEGWFGQNTHYGGADKLGHAFGSYCLTDVFNSIYKHWGYSDEQAILGGVLSSWSLMTLTEIGDGFSDSQGFSWEDEAMNTVGVAMAYLRYRFPSLKDKVDFRIEWLPSPSFRHGERNDPFTDYSGQKYLLAFKTDGFVKTRNPLLKALEVHLGYYTRGYTSDDQYFNGKHRYGYIGIGLNVTYLLEKLTGNRASGIFDYIQVPYTYISTSGRYD
jgi:uncharacterized protein YfiM (DUF2279 family)